jgi:hypothetical protein
MWNWLRGTPRCPVTAAEKTAIDTGFQRLLERFGWPRLTTAALILPTPEYFPDPFGGQPQDIRTLLDRVCGYVGIDPGLIELELYKETLPHGEYYEPEKVADCRFEQEGEKFRLWLEASHAQEPLSLVALLARELALVELVGRQQLPLTEEEQKAVAELRAVYLGLGHVCLGNAEPIRQMAELYTIYLGLGLFTANAALYEQHWHELDQRNNYRMGCHGALSMPMYGYALVLYAWLRDEQKPAWAGELRLDVRKPFKESLSYLQTTGDALVKPV